MRVALMIIHVDGDGAHAAEERAARLLPTLCAQAARAVVRGQRHPVAEASAVFGFGRCALSAALPLALGRAR